MRRLHVALALVVSAAACTFPLIGYQDGTGGGGSVAHGSGGGKSASSATSASATGAPTSSSGGTGGAGTGGAGTGGTGTGGGTSSATSASSSGSGCVGSDPCDCDGDGDRANTPECAYDGGDCNDHDPLVNSKQTMFFTQPGSNNWDYNCDGKAEYEYTDTLSCGFFNCDTSTQKWSAGVPDCGGMGPYATCSGNVIICGNGNDLGMRIQGCH